MSKKALMTRYDLIGIVSEELGTNYKNSDIILEKMLIKEESIGIGAQFFNMLGGSVLQGTSQVVVEVLLEIFGIRAKSYLGRLIANIVSEISPSDIKGIIFNFEEDGCTILLETLMSGIAESIVESMIDAGFQHVQSEVQNSIETSEQNIIDITTQFIDLEMLSGAKSLLYASVREKVFEVLIPVNQRQDIIRSLCDKLSEIDFTDVASSGYDSVLNIFNSDEE